MIAEFEEFVRLGAPVRPPVEPGDQARVRILVILIYAGEPRELVGPAPLHVRVVDIEARSPVAAAPLFVDRSEQVDVAGGHHRSLRASP
jgi:hypothetical protein